MPSSNKVAIVTGASSGIGKAVSLALLKEGYSVALAGRRQELLEQAVAESGAGRRALAVPTDVCDAASVQTVDSLFCVISSADRNLGCFIDRPSAEERRRSTGQQRLLDVIGQTARLEQRPVLAIVPPTDPAYAATPVTCPTDEEQQTDECSFSALENEEVVYEDDAGNRYRLGPAVIAGGDIVEANAVLGGATGSEWTVSFRLSGDATQRFADATTAAVSLPPPQKWDVVGSEPT